MEVDQKSTVYSRMCHQTVAPPQLALHPLACGLGSAIRALLIEQNRMEWQAWVEPVATSTCLDVVGQKVKESDELKPCLFKRSSFVWLRCCNSGKCEVYSRPEWHRDREGLNALCDAFPVLLLVLFLPCRFASSRSTGSSVA